MTAAFDNAALTIEQMQALHESSVQVAKRGPWRDCEVLAGEDGGGRCEVCGAGLVYAVVMENPQGESITVGVACGRTLVKNQMKVHEAGILAAFLGEQYDFELTVQKVEKAQKEQAKKRAAEKLLAAAEALAKHPGANDFARTFAGKAATEARAALAKNRNIKWSEAQAALLNKLVGEAEARAKGEAVTFKRRPGSMERQDRHEQLKTMEQLMQFGAVPAAFFLAAVDVALDGEFITAREATGLRRGANYLRVQPGRELPIVGEYLEQLVYAIKAGRAPWSMDDAKSWTAEAVRLGAISEAKGKDITATNEEKRASLLANLDVYLGLANEGGVRELFKGIFERAVADEVTQKLLTADEAKVWTAKLAK